MADYSFHFVLGFCLACYFLAQWLVSKDKLNVTNPTFKRFQRDYLFVYSLVIMSDWLQGPYLYELYSFYQYDENRIAALYVAGFGSSAVFGTFTGSFADRFGRKRLALVFCVMYSLSCFTKRFSSYALLMTGRVLGGISTSLLFSVFESWYIHEHVHTFDYPGEWMADTFSKSTLLNGVVAVSAGLLSHVVAETFHFGPVSPFFVAIVFLVIAGVVISAMWTENYGADNDKAVEPSTNCLESLVHIVQHPHILLIGVMQSLFESCMYIFVFLWTPVLKPIHPPLGIIFASFMVAVMIGSSIFDHLFNAGQSAARILQTSFILMFSSLAISSVFIHRPFICFFAFLLLEIGCGLYFPAIGYLRGQHVPEEYRSAIMNWFRVPLNLAVAAVLLLMFGSQSSSRTIFVLCAGMSGIGILCSTLFSRRYPNDKKSSPGTEIFESV
eukprot:scpid40098/ scgid6828/ Major facilitator superfamily domain-containing protein 5